MNLSNSYSTTIEMIIVLGALLVLTTGICDTEAQTCGPNNIICVSDSTGTVCTNSDGEYVCINTSTTYSPTTASTISTTPSTLSTTESTTSTTASTTSTTPSTTVTISATESTATDQTATTTSSCTAAGTYAADDCNQYYECVAVMWWYELVLLTCPSGESYDSATGACVTDSACVS